jgi:hypothetical protein
MEVSRYRWEDQIKWIFKNSLSGCGMDATGLADFCEHGKEIKCCMKLWIFLDQLTTVKFSVKAPHHDVSV